VATTADALCIMRKGGEASATVQNGAQPMAGLIHEVSFKGVASPTLRAAFAEFELDAGSGVTTVRCPRATLHVVIARLEELGLELLDVRLVAEHPTPPAS
jgi:hypothetical protein